MLTWLPSHLGAFTKQQGGGCPSASISQQVSQGSIVREVQSSEEALQAMTLAALAKLAPETCS